MDPSERVEWADRAKGIGIILVFYAHFGLCLAGNEAAALQCRLIYSFHMPLFFVLAGYVSHFSSLPPDAPLTVRLRRRAVPALWLNLLVLPLWLLIRGPAYTLAWARMSLGIGTSPFNAPAWFLLCLMWIELLYSLQGERRSQPLWLAITLPVHLTIGLALVSPAVRLIYLPEAFIAMAFYQFGVILRLADARLRLTPWTAMALLPCFAILVWVSVARNTVDVVVMEKGAHGPPLYFLAAALAGSLGVIVLARLLPPCVPLAFVGRHTLPLLGLNGIFVEFINGPVARLVAPYVGMSHIETAALCLLVTSLSITACLPLMFPLRKLLTAANARAPTQAEKSMP